MSDTTYSGRACLHHQEEGASQKEWVCRDANKRLVVDVAINLGGGVADLPTDGWDNDRQPDRGES